MINRYRYLDEMKESGYHTENISPFHFKCLEYLAKQYFPSKDSKIMDLGAGWGHCLIPLQHIGYRDLIAIDVDSAASDKLKKEGIEFHCVDIEKDKLPFKSGAIDVVLSFYVIAHLRDAYNYLSEIYRVLRGGGVFILVTPDWRKQYKTFWRDHTHIHPYDKISIGRILSCYKYDVIDICSYGVIRGLGRLQIWKIYSALMFTGNNIMAVARKPLRDK